MYLYLTCRGAFDAELHHLRLQRRPLHAELRGSAGGTTDEPVRLLKRLANVLALCVFECRKPSRVAIDDGTAWFQLGERDGEARAARQNDRSFDEVFQLADVAGPVVTR